MEKPFSEDEEYNVKTWMESVSIIFKSQTPQDWVNDAISSSKYDILDLLRLMLIFLENFSLIKGVINWWFFLCDDMLPLKNSAVSDRRLEAISTSDK